MATENNKNTGIANQTSLREPVARNEANSKQSVIASACCEARSKHNVAISQKETTNLKPKLRFKEFEGDWEKKKLGEVAKVITGSTPSTSNRDFYDGNKLFISPADIQGNRYVIKTKTTLTELGFSKGRKVQKNSVLFVCIGSTIGKVAQANEDSLTNQQINALEAKSDYNNDFIFSLLNLNGKKIKLLAGVQAVPQINKTDFSNLKYHFPTLPEQQKIANFLTAVDSKIQQLQRKKELLETYKKGVMQQLFSQQVRFKDENGEAFPDWEEKKLGEVFNNIGGTALEKHFSDVGTHKVVSIGNYSTEGNYKENGQRIILNEKTKTKLLDKWDLVMVLNDKTSTGDIIGSTILIPENDLYIYNQRSERLICKRSIIIPMYAWFQLNHKEFRKAIFSVSQGGTQIYVNFSEVKKIMIKIPSLKEQQKIASYLSAIDSKIANVQTQIANTQTFKKGLLQQLFV